MTGQEKIYVRFRGRTLGPLTSQKVQDLIRRGQITRLHELSGDGLSWSKAEEFGDFFAVPRTANIESATDDHEQTPHSATQSLGSSINPQVPVEPTVEWYAHVEGENKGPISRAQLQQWRDSGLVRGNTLVWRSGLDTWQPAEQAIPDIFGAFASTPGFSDSNLGVATQVSSGGTRELSGIAQELDRRRGWAFFFSLVLIVLSSFQIIGQLIAVFIAASRNTAGANTVPALIAAIVGISFAGTMMTAGILLLQYCAQVKELALRPSQTSALMSAKRLSTLWSFVGIASLIWLVILLSFLLILFSIGLTAIDAFT